MIGVPAPFGSHESLSGIVQVEAFTPVRQGPESLESRGLESGGLAGRLADRSIRVSAPSP